jgi:hypothetical protein
LNHPWCLAEREYKDTPQRSYYIIIIMLDEEPANEAVQASIPTTTEETVKAKNDAQKIDEDEDNGGGKPRASGTDAVRRRRIKPTSGDEWLTSMTYDCFCA